MFGEFTANLIHKSSDKFVNTQSTVTDQNRYWFPNLLDVVDFEAKNWPGDLPWPIDSKKLEQLETVYGSQWLCVPSHWYNDISLCRTAVVPVRLYSNDPAIVRLSYILFWMKSHLHTYHPWKKRAEELQEWIDKKDQYHDELVDLQKNYHNWKFLSYKYAHYGLLNNNKPDLRLYITKYFELYQRTNSQKNHKYFYYDIGQALYGDQTNLSGLEQLLDIKIKTSLIDEYVAANSRLVKENLNLSLEDLTNNNFLDCLYDYANKILSCQNVLH